MAGQSDPAMEFVRLWLQHLGDRAKLMLPDARLYVAAQRQADWLAVNDFNPANPHLGENGISANERVREARYRLPEWHGNGNTVESATHDGNANMEEVVLGLMNHATHYDHMHCLGFWEPNYFYGVGCAGTFFVVVTAPEEAL
jgi:hypothetical protein